METLTTKAALLAIKAVLAAIGVIVSAVTRVTLPVLGPTPVLGLVALTAVLGVAAAVLVLLRLIVRDGFPRLRYRTVPA